MAADKQHSDSISKMLDGASNSLDAATLRKLRLARHKALEQETGQWRPGWLPAGNVAITAGAISATAAIAIFTFWLGVISPQARVQAIEDIELLASADTAELYEQMDFYEWLESQRQNQTDAG